MSDAYSDYCESLEDEKMSRDKANGIERWKSLSDYEKIKRLKQIKNELLIHVQKIQIQLSNLNIGYSKEELLNLKCSILNRLEKIGIM